jgi:hypothetical protein
MSAAAFDLSQCLSGHIGEEFGVEILCDSPISVVAVEHYRAKAAASGDLGPSVPVDKFVFGKGEPPQRHLTKVNGLPYRPAGLSCG